MHPGPINRGVEITSDVADSDQAIILDQVENGVAIRMAVLYRWRNRVNAKIDVLDHFKKEKYSLYCPTVQSEADLIQAFQCLESTEHKIIDARSIAFTNDVKERVSSVYESHVEQQKSFNVVANTRS